MSTDEEVYETPKWRTAWLMVGFAVLVGIGIVTVLQPEVEDEPSDDVATAIESSEGPRTDEPLQE